MNTQNNTQASPSIVRGVTRPSWTLSRNVNQLVVLVRDDSGSMAGEKADHASAASRDFVSELAEPSNKDGFRVAVVDFAEKSKVVNPPAKATALDGKVAPLAAGKGFWGLMGGAGSTNITAGLQDALVIIENGDAAAQAAVTFLRPVVFAFTDGCHNEGPPPYEVAKQLKSKADLVTVAFGADADEELLRNLATSTQHFYRCTNGRTLRAFLAAAGATLCETMRAGTNATHALTMIRQ